MEIRLFCGPRAVVSLPAPTRGTTLKRSTTVVQYQDIPVSECRSSSMKGINFESMSTDELWTLHNKIAETLAARIADEKTILEKRLSQLTQRFQTVRPQALPGRRPYPRVLPKYRNPDQPSEKWSGRGKQPRWLTAQLRSGKRIEDFLIASPTTGQA